MRSILRSFRRGRDGTRSRLGSVAPAPIADSSQRGIAPPKSVATSSPRTQLSVPVEVIEVILELFWRNPNLSVHNTRSLSHHTLCLTSRSIRSIIQSLAVRYVVCTSIAEFGIYVNLALVHTQARAPYALPVSIELTTSPLYLVSLNVFLTYPHVSHRVQKVLLKLRNDHNLGELPLFHDTQSITVIPTAWYEPFSDLSYQWLTQAPSLTSVSFHGFDRIIYTLKYLGNLEHAVQCTTPRVTHLTLGISGFGEVHSITHFQWTMLFPNLDTLELHGGPTDLKQLHQPRPTAVFPSSMTTLILHAPPGATLSLLSLWGVTRFLDTFNTLNDLRALKSRAFQSSSPDRDELRMIFDTSDQEPLGWASAVASAAQKGVTFLRRSGCCRPGPCWLSPSSSAHAGGLY
jgi:hypothetical protein